MLNKTPRRLSPQPSQSHLVTGGMFSNPRKSESAAGGIKPYLKDN